MKNRNSVVKLTVSCLLIIISIVVANKILADGFKPFISWYITLLALGVTFFPLTCLLLGSFHDKGFAFSKVIGIAVSGWLLWALSSFKLLKFTQVNCIIVLAFCFLVNIGLIILKARNDIKTNGSKDTLSTAIAKTFDIDVTRISAIAASEAIFAILFVMWLYLKCFNPKAYGTEKFMDYGFMTSMLRSDYMPPVDLWHSGTSLNYYYVGQYLASYVTRLSGVTAGYGYNLMLMTIAAMGFSLPYSLIHNVADSFAESMTKVSSAVKKAFSCVAGTVAGISVAFIGNMHYVVFNLLVPGFRDFLGITDAMKSVDYNFPTYWFPDATRYVGYFPETDDKTIHEFPNYSFVLGDLHAHVINIIFVLTVAALLFAFLRSRKKKMDLAKLEGRFEFSEQGKKIFGIRDFTKEVFSPQVIAVGFFIGLFHMTNYWDYPIYFVVSGAVIFFSNLVIYNFKFDAYKLTALHAVVVLAIAKIVALPFNLAFNKISSSVCIAENHTPLYQLAILWGLPIICTIVYLVTLIKNLKLKTVFGEKSTSKVGKNGLTRLIGNLEISELFILILGLCAIGLVLIPEVIYIKDIYSGSYKRANTMFKLTYQSFIMFGMVMGFVVTKFIFFAKAKGRRKFAIVALILIILSMGYFYTSANAWFNYKDPDNFKTLDAAAFINEENPEDAAAIDWINENVSGTPVILEVNGDSYTYNERVSVLTGCPTVMGWKTHEWLWQSNGEQDFSPELTERTEDVRTIYTSSDDHEVYDLINKYDIEYIYVGRLEHDAFDVPVNDDLLTSIGEVVYPEYFDPQEAYYTTYIVKVK